MTPTPFPLPTATILAEISSIPEASSFFQGFNFDTLLALISCVTGIVALFIGGAAYSYCRKFKNSFNDKKEFEDQSQDHSQRAAGDIINNNGISDNQLSIFAQSLSSMTNANFSMVLDHAYTRFQEQCDRNLQSIVGETKRVIDENKFQIAGYSKIDWIHVYMESAKNASDEFMQKLWARVLAHELASPNTFSYKTLEILKNMSQNEYKLFEAVTRYQFGGVIPKDFCNVKKESDNNFRWLNLQVLKEFGLLSLDDTSYTLKIKGKSKHSIILNNEYLITIDNVSEQTSELVIQCYLLTKSAFELINFNNARCNAEEVICYVNSLKKSDVKNHCKFKAQKIIRLLNSTTAQLGETIYSC